jgi:hypothetical protein
MPLGTAVAFEAVDLLRAGVAGRSARPDAGGRRTALFFLDEATATLDHGCGRVGS